MRWGKLLRAATCALTLAGSAHAATITTPPRPENVIDTRLDGSTPLDLAIAHDLFLTPVTEKLNAFEEVRFERYLWANVPMGKVIVYPDEKLRPFGALTLNDTQYERWKTTGAKNALKYLDSTAINALNTQLPKSLRGKVPVRWRTGFADKASEALNRATPFIPYLEKEAQRYGLPRETWELSIMESLFQPEAVSSASCEGPFQLSRSIAREFGLTIPRTERGGNTTTVNESKHPLLAAEAAFGLVRAYAYHTGGVLTGIGAYHTGPGNIAKMRLLQLRDPQWQPSTKGVSFSRELYTHGVDAGAFDPVTDTAWANEEYIDEEKEKSTDTAQGLSWIVSGGWQHPSNTKAYSQYKKESAIYVPRFVALRNTIKRDAFFITERELLHSRLVRTQEEGCGGQKGPFMNEQPVCWKLEPQYRDTERYAYETFTADRVTIQYVMKQPRGKEPIAGNTLIKFVGSEQVFAAYNPHIPRNARITDGVDVFLPIGTGKAFYETYASILTQQPIITYQDGRITPEPPTPNLLTEDREYARIALLRSEGRYEAVSAHEVCTLSDRMSALNDGSWFRVLQDRVAKKDCSLTQHGTSRALSTFAAGGGK